MATPVQVEDSRGKRIEEIELLDLFPADEGTIDQIFGRVGNGKTYAATADILRRLRRGEVVYCNWEIDFPGYDQRQSLLYTFLGVLGFKREFYNFSKENLRKIELDEQFIEHFELLTDCAVYLDEGHVIFDSYEHAKFSLRKRKAILHTRHFNRTIVIISQRPTAVHVSARANVNRFFKVEKILSLPSFIQRRIPFPIILFRKTEYQDMVNETVDEEQPLSTRFYWGSTRVLRAYNSKYLRGGVPVSQKVHFEAYRASYGDRLALFIHSLARMVPQLSLPAGFSRRLAYHFPTVSFIVNTIKVNFKR